MTGWGAGQIRPKPRPRGPGEGRVLGIDLGTVRVGVAVSDPERRVATPLATLPAGDDLPVAVAALARAEGCTTVVVGLPRALSGGDTAATRAARQVAAALAAQGLDVSLWDERLSSVEADRVLLGAGRRRRQRRDERDRVAAAIILQGWLDARRTPPPAPATGRPQP